MGVQVHYRKTGKGEWVACGPCELLSAGRTVLVHKRSGESELRMVSSTGTRVFQVDGVNCCYGYLEPKARGAEPADADAVDPHSATEYPSGPGIRPASGAVRPSPGRGYRGGYSHSGASSGAVSGPVPPGLHLVDGKVYLVKVSGSGNQYAMGTKRDYPELEARSAKALWVYLSRRPLAGMSLATVMTVEEARAWGLEHGFCAVCQMVLEDPLSVHYGIGPVCFKNLSGKTFAQAVNTGELPLAPLEVHDAQKARRALHKRTTS